VTVVVVFPLLMCRSLEKELAGLIASKDIHARIDSHAKILIARKANQRTATFTQVLHTAEEHLSATRALLLRASMVRFDLVQRPTAGAMPERHEGPPGRHGRQRGDRRERGERGESGSFAAAMLAGAGRAAGWAEDLMRLG
jgi:hypothetical protein